MNGNVLTFVRGMMLAVLGGWSIAAQSLSIDRMVLVSGQNKDDTFILTNNSKMPVFVRTELARIDVRSGQDHETPYTRENLAQWTLTVDPALFILDPGESRKVNPRPLSEKASRMHDEIYAISFVPQAYNRGLKQANSMSIQVGFRAYYIVPATRSEMKYELMYDRSSGKLILDNRGNTAMFARLDQCLNGVPEQVDKPCSMNFMAVAGKIKKFDVPEWLRGSKMLFEVENHDKSYHQEELR
ncbi:fimbrial biogenesis chaperone [Aeromonas jandaei]|uniref:hypothetical protein n=1 Tax=Aeromonas jandaei TaxID=650 RepID=UPI002AA0D77F|nr:hypothetical protein [Aeromonas jandaei]